jgi:hypothetical protein
MQKTKVLFLYEEPDNSVLAVFPEMPLGTHDVACYSQVGQHSKAGKSYYRALKPAIEADYMPLLQELVSEYGYDLEVLNLPGESIKRAISSHIEGRTILVFHDGCVKIFDQTTDELKADVKFIDAEDVAEELEKVVDAVELYEIQQAIKAP